MWGEGTGLRSHELVTVRVASRPLMCPVMLSWTLPTILTSSSSPVGDEGLVAAHSAGEAGAPAPLEILQTHQAGPQLPNAPT